MPSLRSGRGQARRRAVEFGRGSPWRAPSSASSPRPRPCTPGRRRGHGWPQARRCDPPRHRSSDTPAPSASPACRPCCRTSSPGPFPAGARETRTTGWKIQCSAVAIDFHGHRIDEERHVLSLTSSTMVCGDCQPCSRTVGLRTRIRGRPGTRLRARFHKPSTRHRTRRPRAGRNRRGLPARSIGDERLQRRLVCRGHLLADHGDDLFKPFVLDLFVARRHLDRLLLDPTMRATNRIGIVTRVRAAAAARAASGAGGCPSATPGCRARSRARPSSRPCRALGHRLDHAVLVPLPDMSPPSESLSEYSRCRGRGGRSGKPAAGAAALRRAAARRLTASTVLS